VLAFGKRLATRLLREGIPAAAVRATNHWVLLPVALYAAVLSLEPPPRLERVAAPGALVALLAQVLAELQGIGNVVRSSVVGKLA